MSPFLSLKQQGAATKGILRLILHLRPGVKNKKEINKQWDQHI